MEFSVINGCKKIRACISGWLYSYFAAIREAPLSSLELFKVFDEAGLPEGVVNLVIGSSSDIVGELMASDTVRKISFTGSTEVGKKLIRQSADTVKRVSMELGGHAPFIVFEDADIDLAIEGAISSKFSSTGQQCVCTNRIYVHDSIYEAFDSALRIKWLPWESVMD